MKRLVVHALAAATLHCWHEIFTSRCGDARSWARELTYRISAVLEGIAHVSRRSKVGNHPPYISRGKNSVRASSERTTEVSFTVVHGCSAEKLAACSGFITRLVACAQAPLCAHLCEPCVVCANFLVLTVLFPSFRLLFAGAARMPSLLRRRKGGKNKKRSESAPESFRCSAVSLFRARRSLSSIVSSFRFLSLCVRPLVVVVIGRTEKQFRSDRPTASTSFSLLCVCLVRRSKRGNEGRGVGSNSPRFCMIGKFTVAVAALG